jgi:aspartyl protease family protein
VSRILLVLIMLAATAGAVVAYGDPERIARAGDTVSDLLKRRAKPPVRAVQIARGQAGEFALQAKINGVNAPMVIDTGATSVVLTYETAKAAGLPLELLEYDVDVETAGGHTKAARLTLDRLAIGKLVERSVPALVVPHGQMKPDENQFARHELSGPARELGSARRPLDAARLSLKIFRDYAAIEAVARSSTSAIASRNTATPAPGLTPFSAK